MLARCLYVTTRGQRVHTPAWRQDPILPFLGEGSSGVQRLPHSPPMSAVPALGGVDGGRAQAVGPASPTFTAVLLAHGGKRPPPPGLGY